MSCGPILDLDEAGTNCDGVKSDEQGYSKPIRKLATQSWGLLLIWFSLLTGSPAWSQAQEVEKLKSLPLPDQPSDSSVVDPIVDPKVDPDVDLEPPLKDAPQIQSKQRSRVTSSISEPETILERVRDAASAPKQLDEGRSPVKHAIQPSESRHEPDLDRLLPLTFDLTQANSLGQVVPETEFPARSQLQPEDPALTPAGQTSPPTLERNLNLPGPNEKPSPTLERNLELPGSTDPSSEDDQPTDLEDDPNAQAADSELGTLRLRELEIPRPPSLPSVYLLGGIDYFKMDNIFFGIDPIEDSLFRYGLTVLATPALSPTTYLITAVDGNLIRYVDQAQFNYNELRLRAGIFQQLTPRASGEIGWNNQQLFAVEGGDRFLNDHAVYVNLRRRDPLAPRLNLDTFYQFRLSFADPSDRSRLINTVFASLGYDLQPQLQAAIDYQLALVDFTRQDRFDQYHQLIGRLSYQITSNSRVSVFGGYSFGGSSNPNIDFDGSIFGVSLNVNVPLF